MQTVEGHGLVGENFWRPSIWNDFRTGLGKDLLFITDDGVRGQHLLWFRRHVRLTFSEMQVDMCLRPFMRLVLHSWLWCTGLHVTLGVAQEIPKAGRLFWTHRLFCMCSNGPLPQVIHYRLLG